jgi:hypothetical protein
MEITPQVLILVGIICVVLGFIANLLINTLREDEGSPASEPGDADAAPPGGKKGRYDRVSQLWRERGTGRLIVEIEGKSYVNPNPLNEMQREQLEAAARDLRTWLGMSPEINAGAPVHVPEEASPPVRAPFAKPAPPAPATPEVSTPAPNREMPPLVSQNTQAKPSVTQTTAMPAVEIPNVPSARSTSTKKTSLVGGTPPAGGDKSTILPNLSMVAQIEDILQEMIAGTSLAVRDIHLEEDPRRGVIVRVGSELFEGIDSVSDPEVKAAIREAVVAWENGAWRFGTKK